MLSAENIEQVNIYPYYLNVIDSFHKSGKSILVMSGGIGNGKTIATVYAFKDYLFSLTSSTTEPISVDAKITAVYAASEDIDIEFNLADKEISLRKISTKDDVIGLNVIAACFVGYKEDNSETFLNLVNSLYTRIMSRFPNTGKLFISTRNPTVLAELSKRQDVMISNVPMWDVKPEGFYTGIKRTYLPKDGEVESSTPIEVPEEFWDDITNDPKGFIAEILPVQY